MHELEIAGVHSSGVEAVASTSLAHLLPRPDKEKAKLAEQF